MNDSQSAIIEVQGLSKSYGSTKILQGIDLTVQRGQILGYIGPNGSGKTTTVRCLTGMTAEFDGTVRIAGFDPRVEPLEIKRRIGYVPENAVLYGSLTVIEFLGLVGSLHDRDEEETEAKIVGLLRILELEGRLRSRLDALSKGMRQKVLLCSALLHDPQILFLDEPLSGLDVDATILVKELLRALADRGRTIFYCSHLMDVVERVCDRIAVIHKGAILAQGSFDELKQRSHAGGTLESIFAELTRGTGDDDRVERMLEVIGGAGPSS